MIYIDEYGQAYYVPEQVDWTAIFTGIFSLGIMASFIGMAWPGAPEEDLISLEVRIRRLSYVIDGLREDVVTLRNYRTALMKRYGLSVVPSIVEMKEKYPGLYSAVVGLKDVEDNLARAELRMLLLSKDRKKLRQKLGMVPPPEAEELPYEHYTARKPGKRYE